MKNLFRRFFGKQNPEENTRSTDVDRQKSRTERPLELDALEPRVLFSGTTVEVPADAEAEETVQVESTAGDEAAATQQGQVAVFTLLNQESIEAIAEAAADRWRASGLTDEQSTALDAITYEISDLGGTHLGYAEGNHITIDDNAAGNLWFVDGTPLENEEYTAVGQSGTLFTANRGSFAWGKADLLTVIMHEQGNILGLEDVESGTGDLMLGTLGYNDRVLPAAGQAEGATPGTLDASFLDSGVTGSGADLDVRQPFLGVNYAVITQGLFPSNDLPGIEAPFLGEIKMFGGNFAPTGSSLAQGQLLSIALNPALFSILGTTYGGDGQSTFALPDLRGRAPIGAGIAQGIDSVALGEKSGAVTLDVTQLPSHGHTGLENSGGGQPHSIEMPTLGLNYVISTQGVFGSTLGEIKLFAGNFETAGRFADGDLLPIAQNTALFSLLGTTYGGDGVSTFALPDLRGRVAVNAGNGSETGGLNLSFGQETGQNTNTLTTANLPSHHHTLPAGGDSGDTGGGTTFDIVQPTLAIDFAVDTQGVFPGGFGDLPDGTIGAIRMGGHENVFNQASDVVDADGELLLIAQNPALFSLYGTIYGGDGQSTFGLPDLRGRAAVGQGTGENPALDAVALGEKGGSGTVTLTEAQMAAHSHVVSDATAPTVTSVLRQNPTGATTNADSVTFRVTFDEDIQNFDAADLALSGTAAGDGTVGAPSAVTGSSVYDVTITGLTSSNGTVGLGFAGGQNIQDLAGNALTNTTPATDESYTLDNTTPSLTAFARNNPATSSTNSDTLVFDITFDEDVTNVDAGDFDITGTTASGVLAGSGASYTLTLSGGDLAGLNGTVGLNLAAGQNIADTAGNALGAGEPATDETYTLDNVAPTLTAFARNTPATSPTNADTLVFDITFDGAVTNVDATDFSVTGTTASGVLAGSGAAYTLTLSGGDLAGLNGTVGLNLAAGQNIEDTAGNALGAGEPATDETYTLDNVAPTLTAFARNTPATSPTNADTLVFDITFDGAVTNVDATDFSVTGTTASGVLAGSGSAYTLTLSGGDLAGLNGTVGLNLAGGQNIEDTAGNALGAGEPATDETYTLDNVAPTLTAFARNTPATSPTNADTLVFDITFDGAVTNVDATDFSVTGTTASGVLAGSGAAYTLTLSGGDLAGLNGAVGLNLAGGQNIEDTAGNALGAGEPATDETYTLDNIGPTPAITGPASPTSSDPFDVTIDFGDAVTDFVSGDVSVTGGSVSNFTDNGSGNYTVEIDATADGAVSVSVAASVATDAAGNNNAVSNTFNVTVDTTPPTENANTGLTVNESSSDNIIGQAALEFTDDQPATAIIYTLDTVPARGTLHLSGGAALTVGATFTQDDLNNDRVTYNHTAGDNTNDSFQFDVADGSGSTVNDVTFAITVEAVADTTVNLTFDAPLHPDVVLTDSGSVDNQITMVMVGIPGSGDERIRISDTNGISAGLGTIQIDANTIEIDFFALALSSITINGGGGDDTLTIDFSGGSFVVPAGTPAIGRALTFDGGDGNDTLVVTGFTGNRIDVNQTPGAGNIVAGGRWIGYTDVEVNTIDLRGSTANDLVIHIDDPMPGDPSPPPDAVSGPITTTLQNYTGPGASVGVSELTFDNGLVNIIFDTPTNSLTINGDNDDDDIINVIGVDPSWDANLIINGQGGTDTVTFLTNPTALGGGDLDIDAESINFSAAVDTGGGSVTLEANNGVTLTGAAGDVTTGGGFFTVNADFDGDGIGTYTQDNAGSAVSTGVGNVSITAADVDLVGTITTTGDLLFASNMAGTTIGLSSGAGTFKLVGAELTTALSVGGTVTIGAANSGKVEIGGLNVSGEDYHLIVISGDELRVEGNLTAAKNIDLRANQDGSGDQSVKVIDNISITTTTASAISLRANTATGGSGDISIGNVTSLTTGDGGSITLSTISGNSGNLANIIFKSTTLDVGATGSLDIRSNDKLSISSNRTLRILNGIDVTLNASENAAGGQSFEIASGGKLEALGAGNVTINSNGSALLKGTIDAGTGTIDVNANADGSGFAKIDLSADTDIKTSGAGEIDLRINTATGGTGEAGITGKLTTGGGTITISNESGAASTTHHVKFDDATLDAGVSGSIQVISDNQVQLPNGSDLTIAGGILSVDGNLNLIAPASGGSIFNIAVGGTTTAPVDITGLFSIGDGVTLVTTAVNGFVPSANEVFVLIANDGTDPIGNDKMFAGLPEGATITDFLGSGIDATISYVGGTGNDVAITVLSNPTLVTIDVGGNLVITDDDGTLDNEYELTSNGTTLTIKDNSGNIIDLGTVTGGGSGGDTVTVDFGASDGVNAWTGGIIVNSVGGDDSLEIDYGNSSGTDFNNRTITFDGGANTGVGDELFLTGGTFATADYNYTNANDGNIQLTDQGLITYTGLEPVTSTITAADVTLTYTAAAAETITVTDNGATLTVDSTEGETTTFNNPTDSLTITAAADDTVEFTNALSFGGDLTVDAGTIELDGSTVDTGTGDQTYDGAVLLGADATLSGGDVLFGSTVDSDAPVVASLTINAGGDTTFNGVVGGIDELTSVDINSTGSTVDVNAAVNVLAGGFDSSGSGTVTVDGAIDSDGGAISLVSTAGLDVNAGISSTGGAITLTADSDGTNDGTADIGAAVTAAGGNIDIDGSHATEDGVVITDKVTTTGAGTIDITGTGGNGSGDMGVDLFGSGVLVQSGSGTISITGNSSGDEGIRIGGGADVEATGAGDIDLDGTTTVTLGGIIANGIVIQNTGTNVGSAGGAITIDGIAARDYGVAISDEAAVSNTGTGTIVITGTSSGNDDILTETDATITGVSGDITLVADDITIGGNIASSGDLTITPRTASTTIGVGTGAVGDLNIDNTEIGFLQDGFSLITIGDATGGAGAVDVNQSTFKDNLHIVGKSISVTELLVDVTATTPATNARLTARTGVITQGGNGGVDITVSNLLLESSGDMGTSAADDEISLEVTLLQTDSTLGGANGNQFFSEADVAILFKNIAADIDAGSGTATIKRSGSFFLSIDDAIADASSVQIDNGAKLVLSNASDTLVGVTVNEGGALHGNGTLNASITATSPTLLDEGGLISTGVSFGGNVGAINTGDLSLQKNSVFEVDLDGTAGAGNVNGHDQLNVTGSVTLDDAILRLKTLPVGYTPLSGDAPIVIINNDGIDAVQTGIFVGLLEGTYVSTPTSGSLPDQLFQISYQGGVDNNDVTLTATGETATSNVYLDIDGNLRVKDILGTASTDDELSISRSGGNFIIEDTSGNNVLGTLIVGATQTGLGRIIVPEALVTGGGVIIETLGGNDTITLGDLGDLGTLGSDTPLTVDGGAGQDSIIQSAGATATLDGTGAAAYTAESIFMQAGSSLTTDTGNVTLTATGLTGNGPGVRLKGADIISTSGNVDIDGQGGTTGTYNRGILLDVDLGTATASTIRTGGQIDLNGTGGGGGLFGTGVELIGGTVESTGAGPVIIIGSGGAGSAFNVGVAMFKGSDIDAGTGNLSITGTGGSTGTFNRGINIATTTLDSDGGNIAVNGFGGGAATGMFGVGTELVDVDIETTGTGTITLAGTGHTGTMGNLGLKLAGGSTVTTADGAIALNGTGRGTTLLNHGVQIAAASQLAATGAGTITIQGTGSATGSLMNFGVEIASFSTVTVDDGNLSVRGTGGGTATMGRGVVLANTTLESTGNGDIEVIGTGSTTGTGMSPGIEATAATIKTTGTSTGNITLTGSGGTGTSLNNGIRLATRSAVSTVSGTITIDGTGGGNGSSSSGVQVDAVSSVSAGGAGTLTIKGIGADGTSLNEGVRVASASTLKTVDGKMTVQGTARGTGLFLTGVRLSGANLSSSGTGDISILGTSTTQVSTGVFNMGINMAGGSVTTVTGAIDMTGFGGQGATLNQGIRIVAATLRSTGAGAINLKGTAHAETTGLLNSGVYLLAVNLDTTGAIDVRGTGGGLTSMVGTIGLNHGIYMGAITTPNPASVTTTGVKGFGTMSKDTDGNFPFV